MALGEGVPSGHHPITTPLLLTPRRATIAFPHGIPPLAQPAAAEAVLIRFHPVHR
jgi:hypothetical protein